MTAILTVLLPGEQLKLGMAFGGVLSYLWIEGVKLLGPNRCSIFVNLLPILTALLAIVWLHDTLRAFHLIGGGVSLLGVLLAQTVRRPLFTQKNIRCA